MLKSSSAMSDRERLNKVTEAIIGAAIQVHRMLGPGLLESAYVACLAYELESIGRWGGKFRNKSDREVVRRLEACLA